MKTQYYHLCSIYLRNQSGKLLKGIWCLPSPICGNLGATSNGKQEEEGEEELIGGTEVEIIIE